MHPNHPKGYYSYENIQDIIGDLMRTDLNGVLRKVEPIVPIEFEIDIDPYFGIKTSNIIL